MNVILQTFVGTVPNCRSKRKSTPYTRGTASTVIDLIFFTSFSVTSTNVSDDNVGVSVAVTTPLSAIVRISAFLMKFIMEV